MEEEHHHDYGPWRADLFMSLFLDMVTGRLCFLRKCRCGALYWDSIELEKV